MRDTGLTAADAWALADDRSTWRSLRPTAGYAQQWLSDLLGLPTMYRLPDFCRLLGLLRCPRDRMMDSWTQYPTNIVARVNQCHQPRSLSLSSKLENSQGAHLHQAAILNLDEVIFHNKITSEDCPIWWRHLKPRYYKIFSMVVSTLYRLLTNSAKWKSLSLPGFPDTLTSYFQTIIKRKPDVTN